MPVAQGSLTLALITAGSAFVMALISVPLLARAAPRLGLLDFPGGHKQHHGAIPVVGGIAIFLSATAAVVWCGPPLLVQHSVFLLACLLVLGVGVVDDRSHVAPRLRLGLQTLVVTGTYLALGFKVNSLGNLFGTGSIELGVLALPFGILATVALINAFNMLDGLDGLAGGVALIAMLALCALSLQESRPLLMATTAASGGAILGFLLFNLPMPIRSRGLVFLGDGGSTLLGFGIAAMCMGQMVEKAPGYGFQDFGSNVHPAELLWLVAIPVFEICSTTLRRLKTRVSPMQADNGHYHHRLLGAGWSVRSVFLLYLLFSLAAMLTGLSMHRLDLSDPVVLWGFVGVFGLWHLAVVTAERRGLRRQAALVAVGPGQARRAS